ncbi:MAG: riboflavin synthase [Thermoleophilia bacterium]
MFTGIVEEVGRLRSLMVRERSAVLEVEARAVLEGTKEGDSIATSGACLTVIRLSADRFWADAMPETVRRTTLGRKRPGDGLNLERALTLQSRLGGHLVQGHVDGVGVVVKVEHERGAAIVTLAAPADVVEVSVPQGSLAVDGVSLTIVDLEADVLKVSLIPHTVVATTLRDLRAGDEVNLEADLIGKYVRAYLARPGSAQGLTLEKLSEAGFL